MSTEVRQFYEIVAERYAAVSAAPLWCDPCQADTAQMRVFEHGVVVKQVCVMCGTEKNTEENHED